MLVREAEKERDAEAAADEDAEMMPGVQLHSSVGTWGIGAGKAARL